MIFMLAFKLNLKVFVEVRLQLMKGKVWYKISNYRFIVDEPVQYSCWFWTSWRTIHANTISHIIRFLPPWNPWPVSRENYEIINKQIYKKNSKSITIDHIMLRYRYKKNKTSKIQTYYTEGTTLWHSVEKRSFRWDFTSKLSCAVKIHILQCHLILIWLHFLLVKRNNKEKG